MRAAFLVRALLLAPFGIFGEVSELASQVGPFWASVGPEGINAILSLAVDPATTSTLYAGTDGAGVFKSTDRTATWSSSSAGLTDASVRVLTVDPAVPETVYAGTPSGLFVSLDAAASWTRVPGLPATIFDAVVFDPANSLTVYAVSTDAGVFRSADGGASWAPVNAGLSGAAPRTLAFDPFSPSTIYLGTIQKGIYRSFNGGLTWTAMNNGLDNLHVLALAFDPSAPGTIYAGTANGGLFKTINGGARWDVRNNGLGVIGSNLVSTILIDPTATSRIYAATDVGIAISDDGAASWTDYEGGLSINALVMPPDDPATLYAGEGSAVSVGGLWRSNNRGVRGSWVCCDTGIRNISIASMAASPTGALYVGLRRGILRTTDGGATWTSLHSTGAFTVFAIDPSNPATIYTGSAGFGVNKTTDGGVTWPPVNSGLQDSFQNLLVYSLAINPSSPSTVYAGTAGGVFKSTDGAASWAAASTGLTSSTVRALAIDPASTSTIYAATNGGVFKSVNGGTSWASAKSGLPSGTVYALEIDPSAPGTICAGTSSGPYRTSNGGSTWVAANAGHPPAAVIGFARDPKSGAIYAASGAGVFVSPDRGATWSAVNSGLPTLSMSALVFDSAGTLYAGTSGAGVFRLIPASPARQPVQGPRQHPPPRSYAPAVGLRPSRSLPEAQPISSRIWSDPGHLVRVVVEVGGEAEGAFPGGDDDAALLEALREDAGVGAGKGGGEDAGPERLGRSDGPAALGKPRFNASQVSRILVRIVSGPASESRSTRRREAGDVCGRKSARLVAAGAVVEVQLVLEVAALVLDVPPSGEEGRDAVAGPLGDVEHGATFRAEQPLVAVGGEDVHSGLPDVEGKRAQSLDRVEDEEDAALAAELRDLLDGKDPAVVEGDPGHGDDAREPSTFCAMSSSVTRPSRFSPGGTRRPASREPATDRRWKGTPCRR